MLVTYERKNSSFWYHSINSVSTRVRNQTILSIWVDTSWYYDTQLILQIPPQGINCIMWIIVSTGYQLGRLKFIFDFHTVQRKTSRLKQTKQREIIRQSTFQRQQIEGWTNHHRWINLQEVPFDLSWRNRGHRYVNSHVQIDVVDCGVMTVRFGGFFPDGLALLALRRHILFPLWLFVIIMTFAAIVVPKSPPACVHEVCGGWSCCLWGFRLVVAFCDGRKLIIVISDFGRAERRRTQM